MDMNHEMEKALLRLVDRVLEEDVYLEEGQYQKVSFRLYNENIIKNILRKFKFKDVGNVYDYPNTLPQPSTVNMYDVTNNYDFFQRIAVSKKLNAIVFYSVERYAIECTFLIDTDNLKKFSKKAKAILQQDASADMFKGIDFDGKEREYIEVSDATGDDMKPADVVKRKVNKESLVFDEQSTIYQVMQDIMTFFKDDTKKMYDKMQIAYKRGIILYGDPGNGKSAMIRENIRKVPEIAKIVINPNVGNFTKILSTLIRSLNGRQAIIIIEDIDSLITSRNRSEFLNILDGVEIKSGVYFIGTTNYPEQIDPAFMNRSGRFDRTYKINNPSEATRKAFFESRNIAELLGEYKVFKDENKADSDDGVVELFVKYSDNLPMASLKEVMTGTQYLLAANEDMSIEEAVETTYKVLTDVRSEHAESHNSYKDNRRRPIPVSSVYDEVGEF
jgi:hypothetical protein